jgi:hypothetical protein
MDSVGGMMLTMELKNAQGVLDVKLSLAAAECQFGTGASDRG